MTTKLDFHALNAMLNLLGEDGKIQFDADREAARQYFLQHVNHNTVFFHSLKEKLDYLVTEGYYEGGVLGKYTPEFLEEIYKKAYALKFRFPTFLGAFKFYTGYALKTFDGSRFLERYEDRVVMTALTLAAGDTEYAINLMQEMISGRYQPATPTFLNAGKKQRGELISCFEGHTPITVPAGKVRIDAIQIGDEVLTHTGRFRKVTGINQRVETVGFHTLKIRGIPENITATPEHPVLVYRKKDIATLKHVIEGDGSTMNVRWASIKDVLPGDMIAVASEKLTNQYHVLNISDYADISDYQVEEDFLVRKSVDARNNRSKGDDICRTTNKVKHAIALDEAFGEFVGLYLAEGHANESTICFTLNSSHTQLIEYLTATAEKLFGFTPKQRVNSDGSTNVNLHSRILAQFIRSLVGTGFDKKKIPTVMMNSNSDFRLGLLRGVLSGDGCVVADGVVLDLTNRALVDQIASIANDLCCFSTVNYGMSQSGKERGVVTIKNRNEVSAQLIKSLFRDTDKCVKSVNSEYMFTTIDGYRLHYVSANTFEAREAEVFNLHVEEDHTYVANGVIVHNCFLLRAEDNMESIGRLINSCLQLSKRGGGVAVSLTNLREMGAPIKNIENQSSGVIPVMKILEDGFSYANQLGARQGAGAVYLNAHHPDIMRALDTKRENADEKIRIKTLSLGVVIPDITFELAKNNEEMYLFSPYDVEKVYGVPFSEISVTEKYYEMVDDKRIRKTKINARAFFQTIAEIQFESGYPYILFEDTATHANPNGGRINMSNLCVSGDTNILTDKGHFRIGDITGSKQNVWNGSEWSEVDVVQTGSDTKLVQVTLSNGATIDCTPEHKFYVVDNGVTVEVRAGELVAGQALIQTETPLISTMTTSVADRIGEIVSRIEGGVIHGGEDTRLMLQTLGVQAAVKDGAILLTRDGVASLQALVDYMELPLEANATDMTVTVASVAKLPGLHDTFCFTEPKRHLGVFNGVLTGQCSEILQENTASEFNDDLSYKTLGEDISCNLGSLNIAMTMDGGNLAKTVDTAIRALTSVSNQSSLDTVPSVREGNDNSHAVGLGQMNLHGFLARERIHYGSEAGIDFTNMYFYTVLFHALTASNAIAIERGETYRDFPKSKYATGEFFEKYLTQDWEPKTETVKALFQKFGVAIPTKEDWVKLKESVMTHGIYNKYLQAIPPTGSISYINNSTSSIHPIVSKIEIRKEGKIGRVYYPAPFMTNDNLEYYRDAYEIGPDALIDTYAAATQHVDQGLSLTLFFPAEASTRDINRAQIRAWKSGCKTVYYIRLRQEALEGTEMQGCVSCSL